MTILILIILYFISKYLFMKYITKQKLSERHGIFTKIDWRKLDR